MQMIQMRILLFAAGVLCLAPPALAGFQDWRCGWTYGAFEYAHK
jgi:hypothetical protein